MFNQNAVPLSKYVSSRQSTGMDKILLTGGAGYIGSHIAVSLVKSGFQPILIDNFSNSEIEILTGINALCEREVPFYNVDCRDYEALLGVVNDAGPIRAVIHLAAFKAVGESVKNPLKYFDNNLVSMVALLKVIQTSGISNLVFSSSCTVYGSPDVQEVSEETPFGEAFSPYGYTKQTCERMMVDLGKAFPGMRQVSLRYFNPIGAHPSAVIGEWPIGVPNNLVPFITQAAAKKRAKLTVFGQDYGTPDGTCVRDYIHVCDLADAHVAALQWMLSQNAPLMENFNIGTGKGVSVKEIIDNFQAENGVEVPFEYGPRRPGDVPAIFANADKANRMLGWRAKYTFIDALKHAWKWEQSLG